MSSAAQPAAQPKAPATKAQPQAQHTEPARGDMPIAPHVDEPLIAFVAGGLTAEAAAARAVQTSFTARSAEQNAVAASARREQAELDYLPTVTLNARYTRYSPSTPPTNPLNTVETSAPAGTVNPQGVSVPDTGFPVIPTDAYLLQALVTVPISDYFLRIKQNYKASLHAEEAARFDIVAARTLASVGTKQAYYEWLRGHGAVAVSERTLAVAQAHAADAKVQFTAGAVPAADVLRAESAVAAAEFTVERIRAKVISADWTLRTLMHVPDDAPALQAGESLDEPLPSVTDDVKSMLTEAMMTRTEMKSIEKNIEAAHHLASAAKSAQVPSLSAFGDVTYANPNPQRFIPTAEFYPSWSVGALLTWSPKRFFVAGPAGREQEAKAAALEAQRSATRDSIVRDVVDAYTAVLAADTGVATTIRQLDSAREAYRVSRLLYTTGRTTGTTVLEAEYALAQARFDHLNARVDARLARVLLEHAIGRDSGVRDR